VPEFEEANFAVYVHWPFCLAKCPYCDFNSHVREAIDQDRWHRAYLTEIRASADRTAHLGAASSVFFGGGTPSLMDPDLVAGILAAITEVIGIAPGAEITMEANPTSAEAANFKAYRAAGVNRLSLGVQALDDAALKFLGREHSVAAALDALAIAQATFDRVSFDLIYGRPGQTVGAWTDELSRALAFGTGHLSLYQLTIEPGTKFAETYAVPLGRQKKEGGLSLLDDDTAADLFEVTQAVCEDAGLPGYEISNHAKPGQECTHNMVYWRSGDWLGIGPGAHGRLTSGADRIATTQHRSPESWLKAVETNGTGGMSAQPLDPAARLEESVLMAMRLAEGILETRFTHQTGRSFENAFGRVLPDLIGDGFVEKTDDAVRTTPKGRLVLNQIVAGLIEAS
jgi:oxygen-independent coproporphyrinogen-3 oxidase